MGGEREERADLHRKEDYKMPLVVQLTGVLIPFVGMHPVLCFSPPFRSSPFEKSRTSNLLGKEEKEEVLDPLKGRQREKSIALVMVCCSTSSQHQIHSYSSLGTPAQTKPQLSSGAAPATRAMALAVQLQIYEQREWEQQAETTARTIPMLNVQHPPAEFNGGICAVQTPSFQGCCISNPCGRSGSAGGCLASQLYAARFKSVTSAIAAASSASSLASVWPMSSTLITQSSIYTTTLANGALTTITHVFI